MTLRRAKYLLNDINTRIDAMNRSDSAQLESEAPEQENSQNLELQKQKEQQVIEAKMLHKNQQRQNERTELDRKRRVRDAQRVLGPEVYHRYARVREQRVYGD